MITCMDIFMIETKVMVKQTWALELQVACNIVIHQNHIMTIVSPDKKINLDLWIYFNNAIKNPQHYFTVFSYFDTVHRQ